MAFRRRRMRPRGTFGRRRQGGSRWGDAGRKGGVVRTKREWTGWYEFPGCGELERVTATTSDECWVVEHVQVLPVGSVAGGDDQESTLLAFRGTFEPWVVGGADDDGIQFDATGIGLGLQLAPMRNDAVGFGFFPRTWEDCDNSDWLFRRWYPAASQASPSHLAGLIAPTQFGSIFLCGDETSRQIEITKRRVDWSEWALFMTFAWPAADGTDAPWFVRVNARLYESFVGGNSIVG